MNDNKNNGFFSKNNDLRNRILFTVFILSVYRLGTYVPIPGNGTNVPNLYIARIKTVNKILFLKSFV